MNVINYLRSRIRRLPDNIISELNDIIDNEIQRRNNNTRRNLTTR